MERFLLDLDQSDAFSTVPRSGRTVPGRVSQGSDPTEGSRPTAGLRPGETEIMLTCTRTCASTCPRVPDLQKQLSMAELTLQQGCWAEEVATAEVERLRAAISELVHITPVSPPNLPSPVLHGVHKLLRQAGLPAAHLDAVSQVLALMSRTTLDTFCMPRLLLPSAGAMCTRWQRSSSRYVLRLPGVLTQ